jgi:hypothetical protein
MMIKKPKRMGNKVENGREAIRGPEFYYFCKVENWGMILAYK